MAVWGFFNIGIVCEPFVIKNDFNHVCIPCSKSEGRVDVLHKQKVKVKVDKV